MNPGHDEPTHGREYPSLENSPPSVDAHAPVDYPDTGTPPTYPPPGFSPPGYPQAGYPPPGYPPPNYQQPNYQQPSYQPPGYDQTGYPPPPGYPPPFPPQHPGGFSYGYDPYAPVRPVGTNGKAIAALCTSLAGLVFCGLPSIVGLILGVLAMRETKRTGQEGYGLALAGVIIGAVISVLMVVIVVIYAIGIAAVISTPNYHY